MKKILPGEKFTNNQVSEIFLCSTQGGMRRSLKTNTLVLISNKIKSIYQDRMIGNNIYYTGMGQVGNQSLSGTQNKTLNESNSNGVDIHFFEVLEEKVYEYVGEVFLAAKPFQEIQPDSNNTNRSVWMFPLQLKQGFELQGIPDEKIKQLTKIRTKEIRKLSRAVIQSRANLSSKKPGSRQVKSTQFQRNEYVVEETKLRANGICQLCMKVAPFSNKNNEPYLETHHIIWLARGGDDSLDNTVALCPNCHRKMHILDLESDKKILLNRNK